MVFKSLVKKELKNQGYISRKGFDIFNGNDCLDALEFLITLLNPSTKTVLNNIFDIQNKNKSIKKKTPVVTFNDKIEENVIYDDSFELYDDNNEDNNNSNIYNNHSDNYDDDSFDNIIQESKNINNDFDDILPLTPIPEKRVKKYGQYDNEDLINLQDKEMLKKIKKEMEYLKNENKMLLDENKKVKDLLKDITSENGKQDTDLKRLAILKSQVIQLKRQVNIF
ncbi:hypothetical protein BCR32DRAFT_99361 [Anaeromyces robustus]|uniref:Uncharacterized protein n=1 Tax=Anaeromyces robustus TaxID=1754192 RepID=A0A1Y1WIU4_9FUNG|nr:hypothetical protein BCR32DRAFT_99361 [Anaeromyces robustus]|eukprot:ORX73501.1 hypothetical protein BCR32DRAFT_99361 [Anaeromyces robustus]